MVPSATASATAWDGAPPAAGQASSGEQRRRLLLAIHRREWLRPQLVELLQEGFEVGVSEVALPGRRRWRGGRLFSKREMILTELAFCLRLLVRPSLYRGHWCLLCFGGHFGTLLYARIAALLGRRLPVFLVNFYLHDLNQHALVKRILRFLLRGDVRVVAQTAGDTRYIAQFLTGDRIVQLPYCKGESRWVSRSEVELGSYVFSGGWTNRDYNALLRVATRLPQVPFVVVASVHSDITEPVPPNVTLHRDLEPIEFDRLLAKSRLAVVPLRHDVGSSGQMVVLGAMQFSKAAVIPDVDALSAYVRDGESGCVYPHGDEGAMRDAIAGLYRDPARAERVGAAARADYERSFTPDSFNAPLAGYVSRAARSC